MVINHSMEVQDVDLRSNGSGMSSNILTSIVTDDEHKDNDDNKYDTIIIKSSILEFDDEPR